MQRANSPVSLADLSAAGIRLRPYEAVTLVRELVLQVAREEVAGVPSSHVIRLSPSGAVTIEGPVAAGGRSVERAAQLLESLLPAADAGNQFRIPGGLKLVLARAQGTLDLPPFTSLEAFADALTRFAASETAAVVTNLVVTWSEFVTARTPEAPTPIPARSPSLPALVEPFVQMRTDPRGTSEPALTISDIRRARRATRMSLSDVAERSRIPVGLLRQLEWGYLFNWPTGYYGRAQLVRYARATGLDEDAVIAAVEPLMDREDSRRAILAYKPPVPATQLATVAPVATNDPLVDIQEVNITPFRWTSIDSGATAPTLRTKVLAALAIPALLAIGLMPAWWAHSRSRQAAPPAIVSTTAQSSEADRPPVAAAPAASASASSVTPSSSPSNITDAAKPESSAPESRATTGRGDPSSAGGRTAAAEPGQPALRPVSDSGTSAESVGSSGAVAFFAPGADEAAGIVRAHGQNRDSMLRITRVIDDNANTFHVRPSPDGTRIAFDSDRGGGRGVYLANADGKNVRRVGPEGIAAVPSWSPDGSVLAFARAEDDRPQVWNLWTLDVPTGELQQITREGYPLPVGASWFPDGRRIAYSHERQLVVLDIQSGVERTFASPRRGRLLRTPAVSPDGRRVMFQVDGDGAWMLELGDSSMRRVIDDPTADEYTWSSDGRRVAYYSRRVGGWNVWVRIGR
jgi:cytoskeletal protein RodZ